MHTEEKIDLLLDLLLDDDIPAAAEEPLLQVCEALIEEYVDDLVWIQGDDDALDEYRKAYDGRTPGKAAVREVLLPDCLTGVGGSTRWSVELVRRLARKERARDDAMYAHCRLLMRPRPLAGE